MRGVGLACLTLVLCAAAGDASGERKRILVVGELGGVEAVEARGHEVLEPDRVREALASLRERAKRAERDSLTAVTRALARAQDLYLEQDFDKMAGLLSELASKHRWLLSSPEHRELGWTVAFRLGLAQLSRGKRGDRARAARQFALALAHEFEKRPASDLYGPDVASAFGEAVAARERLVPRPVTFDTKPAGALTAIDGYPTLGGPRRNLRPGLHVVRVSAPGYTTRAKLVEIGTSKGVSIELEPDRGSGPVDSWTIGSLTPGRPVFDQFWFKTLAESGADAVLWVGKSRAYVITADRVSPAATGASPRAAAAAALSDWLGGPIVAAKPRPLTSRPLFWGGVIAAAAVVVAGVVLLTSGDDGGGNGGGGISVGVVDP